MSLDAKFRLDGRIALVIGASRGIGRQAALTMAEAGAAVVVAARSADDLEKVAAAAREAGAPQALAVPTDVSALADTRTSGWDKVISLNLRGSFLACRAVLPHMPRGGSIVNVASVAGLRGTPTIGPYGAAKAGLVAMTRTLAVEAAAQGVRVNCLAPGWVRTELTRRLWSDPEMSRAATADVPMGRWGEVEELAGPLLLLASDAGSYITGATLVVDGGQLA